MKKTAVRFFAILCSIILLISSAAAEWRKTSGTWRYYGADGKPVSSFAGMSSITIPATVDKLDMQAFTGAGKSFYIICSKGSYAETFAKMHGFQYDNGEKKVIGHQINNIEEKADWIINNYVVDNYKGSRLTDKETALVLHDWLTTNATYDHYGLDVERRENTYKAEGVLLDGTGVCDSYAQAYSYLLNKVNIQNRYVVGDTYGEKTHTNHAWDLVLIDGQWQFVDVTWDDPNGETAVDAPVITGCEGDRHFLITDEELRNASSGTGLSRIWTPGISADDNVVGFVFRNDGTYYYGDKSNQAVPTTGWVEVSHDNEFITGYYMLYNPVKNKKQLENTGKYYFTENGKMAVGWENISQNRYYFAEDGLQKLGWLTENEAKYHLDETTGAMDTDWTTLTEQERQYNFDTEKWETVTNTNTYYFGADGKMRIGFVDQDGKTYYLSKDKGRLQKDAWVEDGNNKYHAGATGELDKGLKDITGKDYVYNYETRNFDYKDMTYTYFFGADGKMQTGWVDTDGKTYHMNSKGQMEKDVWVEEGNNKYHAGATGELDKGLKETTAKEYVYDYGTGDYVYKDMTYSYYFDTEGKLQTGWVNADGKTYHMNTNGRMDKDTWITDGNSKYHAGTDGTMDTGWKDLKNGSSTNTYYFDEKGKMQVGFVDSNGKTYYLNSSGILEKDRWLTENDNKYHAGKDGALDKGRTDIVTGGSTYTYWFDEKGKMQTGFVDQDGKTYYLNSYGILEKDIWLTENDDKYHAGKDGALDKGRTDIAIGNNTDTYWFDEKGKMQTGLVDQDGKTYFLSKIDGRMYKDEWIYEDSDRYHAGKDGALDKGLTDIVIEGSTFTYYFDENGKLQTGFMDKDGKTYYLNSNGVLEKDSWLTEGNNTYHFGKDGSLDKGLTDISNGVYTNTYWFDEKGILQTGFMNKDGKTYYLAKKDGRMYKDEWIYEDSDRYHAGADGALDKGLTDIAIGDYTNTYYFDENGKMQTGFVESDGKRYHMDENGLMEKNTWVKDGEDRYHMGADGTPDTGWQTIQTENYYFDTDGSLYDRTPGDINDDNRVDGRDAIHLMKWLAGDEVEEDTPFCANGDVDHDKEVDEHDLLRMMKYFGGEKVDLE